MCASLASTPIDWVLAADCCYVDGELEQHGGSSPSTTHFVRACHALCGPSTRCLVSFELRSSQVGINRHHQECDCYCCGCHNLQLTLAT